MTWGETAIRVEHGDSRAFFSSFVLVFMILYAFVAIYRFYDISFCVSCIDFTSSSTLILQFLIFSMYKFFFKLQLRQTLPSNFRSIDGSLFL